MWILAAVALVLSVSVGQAEDGGEWTMQDKYVVLTGGARGIGAACANEFLANGARLVVIVDKDKETGEETTKNLNSIYGDGKVHFIHANVITDLGLVNKTVMENWGNPDVLFNNAGTGDERYPEDIIGTNLIALMQWSNLMYQDTRKDRGGNGSTIINMSDMYAYTGDMFLPTLKAASAGSRYFGETLGHQSRYKDTGVRVVTLCLGFTNTALTAGPMELDEYADTFHNYAQSWKWQSSAEAAAAIMEVYKVAESGSTYTVDAGEYYVSPYHQYYDADYIQQFEE